MRFWGKSSVALFALAVTIANTILFASAPSAKPSAKKTTPQRANELILAGLRPGKDSAARALSLYKKWPYTSELQDTQLIWHYPCFASQSLTVDLDAKKKIQVIRLLSDGGSGTCDDPMGLPVANRGWQTGLGLRLSDKSPKVTQLYGPPDSKSPSSKDGQQLELWYYAFDWAGADVPQVMEVLCTKEKDGAPGRVGEITLAAPSL